MMNLIKYYNYILLPLLCVIYSCENSSHRNFTKKQLSNIIGKNIIYPKDLLFTIQGADTLPNEPDQNHKYTIVSYFDSIGCTSCKMQLSRWNSFIKKIKVERNIDVAIRFVVQTHDITSIIYTLKTNSFFYPVAIDEYNSFLKMNHLIEDPNLNTFLLDSENKIIAVGNPTQSPKLEKLYLKILNADSSTNIIENNTFAEIKYDHETIDFGIFKQAEVQHYEFVIYNIGPSDFIINDIIPSCDCIKIEYDNNLIREGEQFLMRIGYKAENIIDFEEKIAIYCNVKNSPIILSVKGNII